jgi:hypothetical protein
MTLKKLRDKLAEPPQLEQIPRRPSPRGLQSPTSGSLGLNVEEWVPTFINSAAVPRTAGVSNLNEVLAIPWISKLPGNKRLRHFRGQTVVVQYYLGYKLVRAHVHWVRHAFCRSLKEPRGTL